MIDGATHQARKVRDSKPQVDLGMSESVVFMSTNPADSFLQGAPKITTQLAISYACSNSTLVVEHSATFHPKTDRISETVLGKHDSPSSCLEGNSGACGLFEPPRTVNNRHHSRRGECPMWRL